MALRKVAMAQISDESLERLCTLAETAREWIEHSWGPHARDKIDADLGRAIEAIRPEDLRPPEDRCFIIVRRARGTARWYPAPSHSVSASFSDAMADCPMPGLDWTYRVMEYIRKPPDPGE